MRRWCLPAIHFPEEFSVATVARPAGLAQDIATPGGNDAISSGVIHYPFKISMDYLKWATIGAYVCDDFLLTPSFVVLALEELFAGPPVVLSLIYPTIHKKVLTFRLGFFKRFQERPSIGTRLQYKHLMHYMQ